MKKLNFNAIVRICLFLFLNFFTFQTISAQIPATKYPSLLWEITGNGVSKPSYLFGTMHVSNKLVFNLPDSFYYGIQQAQVVALENNPEFWQEEMDKNNFNSLGNISGLVGNYGSSANDYLHISDLQFKPFIQKLAWALSSTPNILNSLLYRSYGMTSNDFEEDTYLDMYIYQIGKKLQKKIAGVEDYKKSMEMTTEASLDMMAEKNKKSRSYSVEEDLSSSKLSDAYRTGNLDWLDTINKVNSRSDAFDEKFLYLRNDIQANSIDSIIKSGSSLFVGVGAAHLPGQRGVIEQLRRKGYKLRPVFWGERSSMEKDRIDNIRIPVNFNTQTSLDGFYSVKTPGKLFSDKSQIASLLGSQSSFADMGNGSYYVVTRIQTNAAIMGMNDKDVALKLDSLLYENIPGKIISKKNIINNGFQGIDITNKTRRGDFQRYRIYITPFEIILFKMSGIGDYVTQGNEADSFFSSIKLKATTVSDWREYTPNDGGFSLLLPSSPTTFFTKNNALFGVVDAKENIQLAIIRNDISNYTFIGDDTVDLNLLQESFASSDFINKTLSQKKGTFNGYPILDAKYSDKKNNFYQCRYIVQGTHYYALIAHYQTPNNYIDRFFQSFSIKPFSNDKLQSYTDSSLLFTTQTTFIPDNQKKKNDLFKNILNRYKQLTIKFDDNDYDTNNQKIDIWEGINEVTNIKNDTTGESILVTYNKPARYYYDKDSLFFKRIVWGDKKMEDSTWIIREKKVENLPNNIQTRYTVYSAKNSSRNLYTKVFYKDGITHTLMSEGDTLTPQSFFVENFFNSFRPIYEETEQRFDRFMKKSKLFFEDYNSPDSTTRKRAQRFMESIYLDKDHFPYLQKAIAKLSWKKDRKYIAKKAILLKKVGMMPFDEATNYLKKTYTSVTDTTELQNAVLNALLAQKTKKSFEVFKEIISSDPPVVGVGSSYNANIVSSNADLGFVNKSRARRNYDEIIGGLYDSLQLIKNIYPELLPLINLDDYKWKIMNLTTTLLDSNQINSTDYKIYFSKFLLEAKQELKKQLALEKKTLIDAASNTDDNETIYTTNSSDNGNKELNTYSKLLLPYYDSNEKVKSFFTQLLQSSEKALQLDSYILLLKNNKKVSDTLANYFAMDDEYRYKLYKRLKSIKKKAIFPDKFNTHLALAKSELLSNTSYYGKPDSLVYIGSTQTVIREKKGNVYFFKYKQKKDDFGWKIAVVGLKPLDTKQYDFDMKDVPKQTNISLTSIGATDIASYFDNPELYLYDNPFSITKFTQISIKSDTPLKEQMDKVLKRQLIEQQEGGKFFYQNELNYADKIIY